MTERKTVVYPNPQVLAEAVAARTLLTIIDLLAEPNRKRVDIAVTGGTVDQLLDELALIGVVNVWISPCPAAPTATVCSPR